ncbi:MAG TPA: hypothetical protein VK507_05065, partial [Iamia sp.]|nr:hypothetical protein [Iamia sp.]
RVLATCSSGPGIGRLSFDDLMLEKRWSPWRAYTQSKLANILFTAELGRRSGATGLRPNCYAPGFIGTDWGRDYPFFRAVYRLTKGFEFASADAGAATLVTLASEPLGAESCGEFLMGGKVKNPGKRATDVDAAGQLWEHSERLLGIA